VTPPVEVRALADRALLHTWVIGADSATWAEEALAMAREIGDPALLARALTACGFAATYASQAGQQYFDEAIELARPLGDKWTLAQVLGYQTNVAYMTGDPMTARAAGPEGYQMAAAVGDRFTVRQCRHWVGWAQAITGDLAGAITSLREVEAEAAARHDTMWWLVSTHFRGMCVAYRGDDVAAREILDVPMPALAEFGDLWTGNAHGVRAVAALAAGEVSEADRAATLCWEQLSPNPMHRHMYAYLRAEAALARADVEAARRCADEAVTVAVGWHRVLALTARARVLIAQGEHDQAERDAHEALVSAAGLNALLGVPGIIELLAILAIEAGRHPEAARLFGAADALRQRIGSARFKVHQADHDSAVARLREAFGDNEFDAAWAEGAALSTEESIAYAHRGRGERQRLASGWGSLTPTELAVVGLVSDGLSNKAIATKLFISLRTVESHLTHVYAKLGLTSRVQLAQEAARRE
jgi:DNA-binding CsgD family transcriptional regulator